MKEFPETDAEGYLVNRDEWTEEVMYELARRDGMELTEEHVKYILDAREMFEKSGTVPTIREFAKRHGMDRKAKPLYELFQTGVMKRIAKWGGLPRATGCT